MNIHQFAALKVGDQIRNDVSASVGEVVTVDDSGVRIRWLGAPGAVNTGPTWHYSALSTAWYHWSKHEHETSVQTGPDDAAASGAPTT